MAAPQEEKGLKTPWQARHPGVIVRSSGKPHFVDIVVVVVVVVVVVADE